MGQLHWSCIHDTSYQHCACIHDVNCQYCACIKDISCQFCACEHNTNHLYCLCSNYAVVTNTKVKKQAQNLCIDASVEQFWKELKVFKSFAISRSLLKCFKNQNKLRICANFVYFPFTQFSMLSPYFFKLLNSKFFAGVNQSQQNSKNCWCFNCAN